MTGATSLHAHLAQGLTTVCRAWFVLRRDGVGYGFTDHDRDLAFGGMVFKAGSGLTARALQQTTGLAVDNTEAVGALSDASVTEADVLAGRFDGAEVRAWLVNWAEPDARVLQFSGTLGEIVQVGGAFRAELRGLTEALNQPQGRVYQRDCSAVLGDRHCGFNTLTPGYFADCPLLDIEEGRILRFALEGFEDRWFERGQVTVLTGAAAGLTGVVKNDRAHPLGRSVELWQTLGAVPAAGDVLRITAGCDRQVGTCRDKFNNFLSFRGFPHVPGEDWLTAYPSRSVAVGEDGPSLSLFT